MKFPSLCPPSPSVLPIPICLLNKRTLHGSLRTRSRQSTHRTDHEVLKDQVAIRVRLAPVVAEVGDLAALIVAHAAEGRVEGAGRRVALRSGGGEGADGDIIAAWQAPQQCARGMC